MASTVDEAFNTLPFEATISGYGGNPDFFTHQGASPDASYHATQPLGDTTGLILTIRAV